MSGADATGVRRSIAIVAAIVVAAVCASSNLFRGSVERALAENTMCLGHLAIEPVIPGQFNVPPGVDGQAVADCLAWQSFVYLNWRVKPGWETNPKLRVPDPSVPPAAFGKPVTDPAAAPTTVWESYYARSALFPQSAPQGARSGHLFLTALNEFSPHDLFDVQSIQQVGGGWLTGQNKRLVFYDVRANPDLRDYIYDPVNHLQSAAAQTRCVKLPGGLRLPHGNGGAAPGSGLTDVDCQGNAQRYGMEIGAIQIKAAWLDLTGAPPEVLSQFLITRADLQYPNQPVRRDQTVGLVGIHIVRKVPGKPGADQLLWATFEHVRNAPDAAKPPGGTWTFNNGTSSPAANVKPRKCPNPPATPSPGCTPYDVPIQVARAVPIAPQQRDATEKLVALIGNNPSVFKNYELVHVQWPTKANPPAPGATVPLSVDGMVPSAESPVANAVIETYMQINQKPPTRSCIDCHSSAAIAATDTSRAFKLNALKLSTTPGTNLIPIYPHRPRSKALGAAAAGDPASDYSFLFLNAN